jgi:ribosomal protein L11 methyltransferase
MNWLETKVEIDYRDVAMGLELVADIFYAFDLQGVVVDDPTEADDLDWAEPPPPKTGKPAVTGYLPCDGRLDRLRGSLGERLEGLRHDVGLEYKISYVEMAEEDWAESWKEFFWPEKIGHHIVVKPTWREYERQQDDVVIEIDPGMAFGTGTHPTTALCVRLIEDHVKPGDRLLDVGCGSGILMLAAKKMGAGFCCGIDRDEVAPPVAAGNLVLNRIPEDDFGVCTGSLGAPVRARFDVLTANILTDVILALADDLPRLVLPGGIFICSGIIEAYRDKVLRKLDTKGFTLLDLQQQGEWVAMAFKKAQER